MVQPNAAAYVGVPADPGRYCCAARTASNRCATEGSEEDLNRRQQRKQRGLCLGFCDGHPVGVPGDSPVLQSSSVSPSSSSFGLVRFSGVQAKLPSLTFSVHPSSILVCGRSLFSETGYTLMAGLVRKVPTGM